MDRIKLLGVDWPAFIDRISSNVEHATHHGIADRHRDGLARVDDFEAALESFGAGHGDGAHPTVSEVLLYFECQLGRLALNFIVHGERMVNLRYRSGELDVYHRADHLNNFACIHAV